MPMTVAQLADMRMLSGDDRQPYDLTDDQMNTLYDSAAGDEATTVAYILRRRVGKAANLVALTTIAGERSAWEQKYQHLREMLEYWERKAGLSGAIVGAGFIDLDLDQEDE